MALQPSGHSREQGLHKFECLRVLVIDTKRLVEKSKELFVIHKLVVDVVND